jgi:hypothetical protein
LDFAVPRRAAIQSHHFVLKPRFARTSNKKTPANGVKRLGYVQLYEERRLLFLMEQLYHPLCIEEVVMDTSLLYEGILGIGDQIINMGCKSVRENFRDDLCHAIN